jgi:hypothetical protein
MAAYKMLKMMTRSNLTCLLRGMVQGIILCFAISCTQSHTSAVYDNKEYGIRTQFPSEHQVCIARSGDHPVGFYIWLDKATECETTESSSTRKISVTANYNSAFEMNAPACPKGKRWNGLVDNSRLQFPGLPSVHCAIEDDEGIIEILVMTQAGHWRTPNLNRNLTRTPSVQYQAYLRTNSKRVRKDLSAFVNVLSRTIIKPITLE